MTVPRNLAEAPRALERTEDQLCTAEANLLADARARGATELEVDALRTLFEKMRRRSQP